MSRLSTKKAQPAESAGRERGAISVANPGVAALLLGVSGLHLLTGSYLVAFVWALSALAHYHRDHLLQWLGRHPLVSTLEPPLLADGTVADPVRVDPAGPLVEDVALASPVPCGSYLAKVVRVSQWQAIGASVYVVATIAVAGMAADGFLAWGWLWGALLGGLLGGALASRSLAYNALPGATLRHGNELSPVVCGWRLVPSRRLSDGGDEAAEDPRDLLVVLGAHSDFGSWGAPLELVLRLREGRAETYLGARPMTDEASLVRGADGCPLEVRAPCAWCPEVPLWATEGRLGKVSWGAVRLALADLRPETLDRPLVAELSVWAEEDEHLVHQLELGVLARRLREGPGS